VAKQASPTGPEDLAAQLGNATTAWTQLRTFVDAHAGVASEWKFYGEKYGWQLKLVAHGRALAYLVPKQGAFVVASAVRAPVIRALREAGYPEARVLEIEAAREAPEGKPARIEVRGIPDLAVVEMLLATKLQSRPSRPSKPSKRPSRRR
jgi:hypothetical protein